ncbi:MAG: hypothetical protein ACLFP6_01140 [Spirochaetaceae bacterium]
MASLPLLLIPALSLSLALASFYGQRKNRRIARELAHCLEHFYQPEQKRYQSIGGVIGYHIYYQLSGRIRRLVGTLTLLPRHALLYLPISRLLGRTDQLRLTLHTDATPLGEGHIVDPRQYSKGWLFLADEEEMERREVRVAEREYLILTFNPMVADRLETFLNSLPKTEGLIAFSSSRLEKQYTFITDPDPESLLSLITGAEDNFSILEVSR